VHKVILDMDPGIDDALALLLALKSPEIQILSIGTVAGNAPAGMAATNTRRVLEYMGVTDIPVTEGAAGPLKYSLVDALYNHGQDGLGQCGLPAPKIPVHPISAMDFMAQLILEAPGNITLVATGPLTNVALAFQRYPRLSSSLARLVLMGGAYGLTSYSKGNKTPFAEFNIWQDPEAAHIVLNSGVDIYALGLDVSMDPTTHLKGQHLEQLRAGHTPAAALAAQLSGFAIGRKERCELHDPLTLASVVDNSLLQFESLAVEVLVGEGPERGVTRVLQREWAGALPLIHVASAVDGPRFLKLFLSRMLEE
jgi:inosine-uridine nucleoside N-ribohydrolase